MMAACHVKGSRYPRPAHPQNTCPRRSSWIRNNLRHPERIWSPASSRRRLAVPRPAPAGVSGSYQSRVEGFGE